MQIGKYEIVRRLATGGMAEIYLARATGTAGFEKLVVLKRILPEIAEDETFVTMFLDEARLAATLRHPNIADVYDAGEADGTYFFTMEYVHGQDVRTIRRQAAARGQPVPLAIALAIIHATASALDHAHDAVDGLIHRDVSASNIIVSYDGAVKLLDFGIARSATSSSQTRTGTLKGKIDYMSPEQCRGLPLDRRTDLFSLGIVLYELTVGEKPFVGETDFAIMHQIVHTDAHLPADYPPELAPILRKLLARELGQRYATADGVLHDLDALITARDLFTTPRALGKYMRDLFDEVREDTGSITFLDQAQAAILLRTGVSTTHRTTRSRRTILIAFGAALVMAAILVLITLAKRDTASAGEVTVEMKPTPLPSPPIDAATLPPPEPTITTIGRAVEKPKPAAKPKPKPPKPRNAHSPAQPGWDPNSPVLPH